MAAPRVFGSGARPKASDLLFPHGNPHDPAAVRERLVASGIEPGIELGDVRLQEQFREAESGGLHEGPAHERRPNSPIPM